MFLVERMKFFILIMGRTYDGGKKLMKAEKKAAKQENKKEEPAKTDVNIPGDENMPMLISDDDDISDKGGTEKKFTFKKPPLWKCHNDNDIGDEEGTEKRFTTKKPPSQKPPCK